MFILRFFFLLCLPWSFLLDFLLQEVFLYYGYRPAHWRDFGDYRNVSCEDQASLRRLDRAFSARIHTKMNVDEDSVQSLDL